MYQGLNESSPIASTIENTYLNSNTYNNNWINTTGSSNNINSNQYYDSSYYPTISNNNNSYLTHLNSQYHGYTAYQPNYYNDNTYSAKYYNNFYSVNDTSASNDKNETCLNDQTQLYSNSYNFTCENKNSSTVQKYQINEEINENVLKENTSVNNNNNITNTDDNNSISGNELSSINKENNDDDDDNKDVQSTISLQSGTTSNNIPSCFTTQKYIANTSKLSYTPAQLELLNEIYSTMKYPNSVQKSLIAQRVAITRDQVKIWFQNRRRKDTLLSQGKLPSTSTKRSRTSDNDDDNNEYQNESLSNSPDQENKPKRRVLDSRTIDAVLTELKKHQNAPSRLSSKRVKTSTLSSSTSFTNTNESSILPSYPLVISSNTVITKKDDISQNKIENEQPNQNMGTTSSYNNQYNTSNKNLSFNNNSVFISPASSTSTSSTSSSSSSDESFMYSSSSKNNFSYLQPSFTMKQFVSNRYQIQPQNIINHHNLNNLNLSNTKIQSNRYETISNDKTTSNSHNLQQTSPITSTSSSSTSYLPTYRSNQLNDYDFNKNYQYALNNNQISYDDNLNLSSVSPYLSIPSVVLQQPCDSSYADIVNDQVLSNKTLYTNY